MAQQEELPALPGDLSSNVSTRVRQLITRNSNSRAPILLQASRTHPRTNAHREIHT